MEKSGTNGTGNEREWEKKEIQFDNFSPYLTASRSSFISM